jgi:hypothetical protein
MRTYPDLKLKRSDAQLLNEHQRAKYDPRTGLVWIEDGTAGVAHGAHPNVEANAQTRRMHPDWLECRGFLYSPEVYCSTELDQIAATYCHCGPCDARPLGEHVKSLEVR